MFDYKENAYEVAKRLNTSEISLHSNAGNDNENIKKVNTKYLDSVMPKSVTDYEYREMLTTQIPIEFNNGEVTPYVHFITDKELDRRLSKIEIIEEDKSIKEDYIDFITVEHLKLPADNTEKREFLLSLLSDDIRPFYKRRGREYELKTQIKLKNINKIKENCNVKIGIGDNDLMLLSDTNNCCGIDTINKNFDNWLQYNKITIEKTKCKNYWCPSCKLTNIYPYITKTGSFYKQCVDYYIENINKEHQVINQMSLF